MIDEEKIQSGTLLYERYYAAMLKRAKCYVGDIYDAADIVSNCWIRLIPRIHALMSMDEHARSSYIMTTVQNEAIDYSRKQQRQRRLTDTVELCENIAHVNAWEAYNDLLTWDTLSSMLAMLPPKEARIVRFKLNGISNEEISGSLHISQSTVRVYWKRGRERLRLLIQRPNK